MAIGNTDLMHVCIPKHIRMGTARMKDNDTKEEGKKQMVNLWKVEQWTQNK